VPKIVFPHAIKSLTNAQKLAIALKLCRKERKKQRSACERVARKRYKTKGKRTFGKKGK
jgi:hypothetical protein